MRQSIGAVALIRRQRGGQTEWLARWNDKWQCYHFVSGHRRPNESFRQCLLREVGEELRLREGEDFAVGTEPLARFQYPGWSGSAQAETLYTTELFEVELTGEGTPQAVEADPRNRWLTEAEIRARACEGGQPVSGTMALLLTRMARSRRHGAGTGDRK